LQKKHDTQFLRGVCLAFACVTLCLTLTVGVTYARYQWESPRQSYVFAPDKPDQVLLSGSITEQALEEKELPSFPEQWVQTENGLQLDFAVTNGTFAEPAQRNQKFTLYLTGGVGIGSAEALTVTIHWQDGAGNIIQTQAVAQAVERGTLLYDSMGDGWIYRFFEGQQELKFLLEGGEIRYENFTLTVSGLTDPAMLDLRVQGDYVN
jgi:hypothetical protein